MIRTRQELATQLVVGLEGSWPTAMELSWLKKWKPYGIILFSRNVESFKQLRQLCTLLKNTLPALQIMADHEGGPVSQLAAAVGRPPVAYGLGVFDDTDLTRRVHAETGRRLRAAGLDWVLAPCADILSEPRNPVIGARAFGNRADLVSRHVAAAVEGLRSAGILACLKHWPGHGSSSTDSHLESSTVEISASDEEPFRAGLAAGAEAIMPGHLVVQGESWPATLSKEFLAGTRRSLADGPKTFKLIADDVSMGALREPMTRLGVKSSGAGMVEVADLPLQWFEHLAEAGCDLFLIRALPLGAFPCGTDGVIVPSRDLDEILQKIVFESEPYQTARGHHLRAFKSHSEDLISLDLARDDRWQVAGALTADHWQQWDRLWSLRFRTVLRVSELDRSPAGGEPVTFLLVTSHRPLPENWLQSEWANWLQNKVAESGQCLVMGHPSLEREFRRALPGKWNITPLYDVSCDVFDEI